MEHIAAIAEEEKQLADNFAAQLEKELDRAFEELSKEVYILE